MQILIIGSGGREHALAWKCAQDINVKNVYVAPGNAGTALECKVENVSIEPSNQQLLLDFCNTRSIDLVIIGPEAPLVEGLADFLGAQGIPTFGPSQHAAQLEGSKTFAKEFFAKYHIPTAAFVTCHNLESAKQYLTTAKMPIVVKADGLAAGKGVIICNNYEEAEAACVDIFEARAFGDAGNKVVIEEFLTGEEASFIAVVSGNSIIPLATSQDHKAVGDNDEGLNTGGMGAYSPAPIITDSLHQKVMEQVMLPTMTGLINEGAPYLGFLYAGLMIENGQIKVLEFNCRFGDPETQPIMMRLQSSLVELCLAAINNKLDSHHISWSPQHACGVVLAAKGYPQDYQKGHPVKIADIQDHGTKLFHAGTTEEKGIIKTNGGRVFCMTALGENLATARKNAYNAISTVDFDGMFYRSDIGAKGLKND